MWTGRGATCFLGLFSTGRTTREDHTALLFLAKPRSGRERCVLYHRAGTNGPCNQILKHQNFAVDPRHPCPPETVSQVETLAPCAVSYPSEVLGVARFSLSAFFYGFNKASIFYRTKMRQVHLGVVRCAMSQEGISPIDGFVAFAFSNLRLLAVDRLHV